MARLGGNPDLKDYKFKAPVGRESYNKLLQLMVANSILVKLKSIPGWQDFLRELLSRELSKLPDSSNETI